MSKGIFTAAQAALVAVLALFIGTTAAEAGGGASRGSTCYPNEKVATLPPRITTATASALVPPGDTLENTLTELLGDAADKPVNRETWLHKAASWAAKTQKKGPWILLDHKGCEWNVSSGKDLIALWSLDPNGFTLNLRPVDNPVGGGKKDTAKTTTTAATTPAAAMPMIIRVANTSEASRNADPAPEGGGGGSKSSGGGFLKNVMAADAAEDLMLRNLGRLKETIDGPSVSLGPPKSNSHASYDYEVKGALGYKFEGACSNVDNPGACVGPIGTRFDELSLTVVPFASVWYGTDKGSGAGNTLQIDRFSLGTVLESGIVWGDNYNGQDDAGTQWREFKSDRNSYGLMLQVIPQFITDHRFEAKIAYVEGRLDVAHLPSWSWCFTDGFDGINYSNVGPNGNSQPDGDGDSDGNWGNITCSMGVILDYAHEFREGLQHGLLNSFARVGSDVGLSFKPITDCESSSFAYCDFAKGISFQFGYRNLWDYSNENGSIHRFTSSLKYTFPGSGDDADSSKGPSISVTYTDGLEDITKAPIPAWKVSFSTGN